MSDKECISLSFLFLGSREPMSDESVSLLERKVRVLRDWVIPSTLIIGICISIILFVFSSTELTKLLKASAIALLLGVAVLVYNLLHIFGCLGFIEESQEDISDAYFHIAYIISLFGILAFMVSLSLLCLAKSLAIGIFSVVVSTLVFIIFLLWAVSFGKSHPT